ncbi:hypothetical protein CO180_03670 [candidate division WWE3 bacterium CG_4_9_14_3_um_filter_41_6]|nr:MAG: hypothetical protein CO180_03670 [candidate division WWE3 bacterium CG_4_9_14_3_um_filter_41_6]
MGSILTLFLSGREIEILIGSISVSAGVALVVSLFASTYGLYALLNKGRFSTIFQKVLLIPLFIPPYFHALSIISLFQWISYNHWVSWISLSTVSAFRSEFGLLFVLSIAYIPLACLLMQNLSENIDRKGILTALTHQGFMAVVRKIILPQLMPSVYAVFGIVFTLSFISFDVASLLEVPVYATEIFSVISSQYNLTRAVQLSLIPFGIAVVTGFFVSKAYLFASRQNETPFDGHMYAPRTFNFFAVGLLVVYGFVSVVVPLTTMFVGVIASFPSDYLFVLQSDWLPPMVSTLKLCFYGGLLSITISWMMRDVWKTYPAVRLVLLSSLLVSPTLLGITIIYVIQWTFLTDIQLGIAPLVVAYSLRTIPITSELLHITREKIPRDVFASIELIPGITRTKRFVWEFLLMVPTLIIMVYASFWIIATEIPLTILLQPPGFQTIMARIFILLHYGSLPYMNIMMLATIATLIAPLIGIVFLRRRLTKIHH